MSTSPYRMISPGRGLLQAMAESSRPPLAWLAHLALPGRLALAGAIGALWDEHLRAGFSTWQTLCRSGSLGALDSLTLYAQLLPWSTLAILTTALVSLVFASPRHASGAQHALVAHIACWLAMPVSIALCVRVVQWDVASRWSLAVMFVVDFVLMAAAAATMRWLTRPGQELNLRPLA